MLMTYEDQMLIPLRDEIQGKHALPAEGTGKKKTELRINKNFRVLIKWIDEILDGGLNHHDIASLHVRLIILFFGTEQKKADYKKIKLISDLLDKAEKSLKSHKAKLDTIKKGNALEQQIEDLKARVNKLVELAGDEYRIEDK